LDKGNRTIPRCVYWRNGIKDAALGLLLLRTFTALRIVSLTCSNTEIVCALGLSDALVGVDDHSDFPEEVVASLPRVGPDLGINIDAVAALKPDLVLASLTVPGHEKIVEGLEQAGLPFLAPEPTCLEHVFRDIDDIARAAGVADRATAVIDALRATTTAKPDLDAAPTILIQWWPKPVIAPGKQSWVNDLLSAAGGRNPLFDRDVKSAPLEDAEVSELDPDAIVISWCGVKPEKYRPDVIYRNPAFADMKAIRDRRVFCVSEGVLGRPSPRLADGVHALSDIVKTLSEEPAR